jgi:hypothetical protein
MEGVFDVNAASVDDVPGPVEKREVGLERGEDAGDLKDNELGCLIIRLVSFDPPPGKVRSFEGREIGPD